MPEKRSPVLHVPAHIVARPELPWTDRRRAIEGGPHAGRDQWLGLPPLAVGRTGTVRTRPTLPARSSHPAPVVPSDQGGACLLYTSPSPRDRTRSRMPSSA